MNKKNKILLACFFASATIQASNRPSKKSFIKSICCCYSTSNAIDPQAPVHQHQLTLEDLRQKNEAYFQHSAQQQHLANQQGEEALFRPRVSLTAMKYNQRVQNANNQAFVADATLQRHQERPSDSYHPEKRNDSDDYPLVTMSMPYAQEPPKRERRYSDVSQGYEDFGSYSSSEDDSQ